VSPLSAQADRIVDCRNLSCPLPVVRTAQAIKELGAGQHLLVMATDAGYAQDVRAWSSRTGNEVIGIDEIDGAYHVLLRRN